MSRMTSPFRLSPIAMLMALGIACPLSAQPAVLPGQEAAEMADWAPASWDTWEAWTNATDWGAAQSRRRRIVYAEPGSQGGARHGGDFGPPKEAPRRLASVLAPAGTDLSQVVVPAGGNSGGSGCRATTEPRSGLGPTSPLAAADDRPRSSRCTGRLRRCERGRKGAR